MSIEKKQFKGHTPGPWFTYFDDSPLTPVTGWKLKRDSDIQEPIALFPVMTAKGKKIQEANSKLCASAPALLYELVACKTALRDMLTLNEHMMEYVGQMALPNYRLLNEAPIAARAALKGSI